MTWYYKGVILDSNSVAKEYVGFVYKITNLTNNKKYIGKKLFWTKIKKPPLKGMKKKRTSIVQSDWQNYYGSSLELQEDVKNLGFNKFHREILYICYSKSELNYIEMHEQIVQGVLLRDDYYNNFIGSRISGNHLKGLKYESLLLYRE